MVGVGSKVVTLNVARGQRNGELSRLSRPVSEVEPGGGGRLAHSTTTSDSSIVADLALPPPRGRSTATAQFPLSILASLLLHGALVGYFCWCEPELTTGAGGRELDAISVEILLSSALESPATTRAANAAGLAHPVEALPGLMGPVEQMEIAAVAPALKQEAEQPEALRKPDEQLAPNPDLAAAEIVNPKLKTLPEPELPLVLPVPKPEDRKDMERTAAQPAFTTGGPVSRAQRESDDSEGTAGASQGQLTRFAIEVRIALGKSRPRHSGGQGRAEVAFVLTDAGQVRHAEISSSSGKSDLDRAALDAVQRTVFPRPPVSTTEAQRSYTVGFDFK